MSIRLIASLLSMACMVSAYSPIEYGNFVYRSKDASPVTMIVNTTKDGMARFTIECGRRYEGDWFRMQKEDSEGVLNDDVLNEFPTGSYEHRKLLHYSQQVCPQLHIESENFRNFYVDSNGNLETELESDYVVLKRQWLPLTEGRYISGSESQMDMRFDVRASGSVYVRLGCKALPGRPADGPYPAGPPTPAGTTDYKLFRLVKKGSHYELATYPGHHDTVAGLISSFKQACPVWRDSFDFEEEFKKVKFATPDIMYAYGDYIYDRLFRHPF
ncbi:hypothetical protein FOZ62_031841 [Perkinsus olseni]|uniref:Uncharacterized protein n=1 Tax=Perkinsus olseni TaxID=32597 RepID=A0A7J6RYG8_PEROL|nr:hypothetical protein FOZ62_031841 [Perkinsus olseni]